MDEPAVHEEGACPFCGHMNDATWVLCDACGQRLPWAPPPKAPPKISDLTEEQLVAKFAYMEPSKPSWFFTKKARFFWIVVSSLLTSVLWRVMTGKWGL